MSKYFLFREMIASENADAYGISNIPEDLAVYKNLEYLMTTVLDPLRENLMCPLYINSGYRCPTLNSIIRGEINSMHLYGLAADVTTRTTDGNQRLVKLLQAGKVTFDMAVVYPRYTYIHIQIKREGENKHEVVFKRG